MRFEVVTAALLCVDTAFAAYGTALRRERAAKHAAIKRDRSLLRDTSLPNIPVYVDDEKVESLDTGNDTGHVEYSSNWSGAVLIGTGYKYVTGTFVVPTPKTPTGGSSRTQYAASAWVGIDGDTAQNSILQTGIDFYVKGSSLQFDAWYEWYPDYAYDFSGITIAAGDTVTVSVNATTTSGGIAVVENVSTGKTVTHTFSAQTASLQELNAEWIVEDFSSGGSLVPFANFGTVTFTGAYATGSDGTVSAGTNPTLIDIRQNNKVLTSASASGDTVTVTYTA